MRFAAVALAAVAACSATPSPNSGRDPTQADVRNVSASCSTQEYNALNHKTVSCQVTAEVVVSGPDSTRPRLAYIRKFVNEKEQPRSAAPVNAVLILDGRGTMLDYVMEDRPLTDPGQPPKIEYRVGALQPLEPVK